MNNIEFRQRDYDGKWMKMVRTKDYDNMYSYKNEKGYKVKIVPDKWTVQGVCDFMMEIE